MELEDAIKHCEEVAEAQEENCKYAGHDHYTKLEASACAAEHRQLAEWLKELKERRTQDVLDTNVGDMTSRLDNTISDVAYILDTLMAYRNIVDSGDCNRCGKKKSCGYAPKIGQLVRYNCPFYKRAEGE